MMKPVDIRAELVGRADGPESFEMRAGMLIVVPQGHWHRFHAA